MTASDAFFLAAAFTAVVACWTLIAWLAGEVDIWGRARATEGSVLGRSLGAEAWRRLRRNRAAVAGFWVAGVIVAFCFTQPALAARRLPPPTPAGQAPEPDAAAQAERPAAPPAPDPGPLLRHYARQYRGHVNYAPSWSGEPTPQEKIAAWRRAAGAGEAAPLAPEANADDLPDAERPAPLFFLMGTDAMGRDLFARVVYGGQISFLVAIVATLVTLVIGVSYGALSGYRGGWADQLMMRFVDFLYAVPFLFLVIILMTLASDFDVKAENRLILIFVALGLVEWLTLARISRGQVISLKSSDFVVAARAGGATPSRVVFRHLVPNIVGPVIAYSTITVPAVMLEEAFLSYLGLGIAEPQCSWGTLAQEGAQAVTALSGQSQWWLITFPAGAMALALFALNFLGDGLRDALDPRARKAA
ncbi:MAG: ABC transporter permease [Planctomycetes bacterium]|nr:ABC transporter permease [Planctomycetota bacterium]